MKKLVTVCAVMLLCACMSSISLGDISIDVYASSAPNAYGSPSWGGYVTNALYALENGLSVNGDRSISPTGYERAPATVGPGEIAVTSFNSWRGGINPTGAFANEYGNRMHFGLHAYGSTQFTLADLTFDMHSSDSTDSLKYTGNFVGYNYSATRHGINWGADGVKGGGDDTVYTSGNGGTLVNEIVYVGVGNAWWPQPGPGQTNQQAMDDYFAWVGSEAPIDVKTTYSILGYTGSDTVTVVPLPAALLLGMLGLSAAGLKLRKFV